MGSVMDELKNNDTFHFLFAGGRLSTYKGWSFDKKKNASCNSINLAKAGFIMDDAHSSMCPFTGKTLEWEHANENPYEEHRNHCSNCPYVPLMDKDEADWTIDEVIPLYAALATQAKMKQIRVWTQTCARSYSKIESRFTPYIPKNAPKEEQEDDDEE